jgi:hypothetical protein
MENNPLANYFRQPSIFLTLPSKGRWWKEGALEIPEIGELPIYPMSTKDEIMLKTPDALMNGQGVVSVIQSCCPSIKDAWAMPSIDVDAVLIAIRIASYGTNLEFDSKCPHCGEENSHEVNLTERLSAIKTPDYSETITFKDLKIKLKPQSYFSQNKANMMSFEEEQLLKVLNMPDTVPPEEKARLLNESIQRIVDLSLLTLANGTEYIEIKGDERVTKLEFITDFYKNADSALVESINSKLTAITDSAKSMPLNLQCNECAKQYTVDLTFDYSSFFAKRS